VSAAPVVDRQSRVRRLAAALDRWGWVALALAAAWFLVAPTPPHAPLLLIVPALWLLARLAGEPPVPRTPLNLALLLLALMVLVSLYATYDVVVSLPFVGGTVFGIAIFYAFVRASRTLQGWLLGFGVYLAAGAALAGIGLFGAHWTAKFGVLAPVIALIPPALAGLPGVDEGVNPNILGGTLLWVLPAWIAVVAVALSAWPHRRALAVALALIGLAVTLFVLGVFVLAESRGSYLALAAATLALAIVALPGRARPFAAGSLLALAVAAALLIAQQVDRQTLQALEDRVFESDAVSSVSLEGRVERWSRALYGIEDFPITGMGMGTFRHVVPILYPLFATGGADGDPGSAHDEFLQVAVDLGVPGLVAFAALYLGAFWLLAAVCRAGDRAQPPASSRGVWRVPSRTIALCLGWALLAHLLYGLTDAVMLGTKPGVLFWMLLGLIAGLYQQYGIVAVVAPPHPGAPEDVVKE
jgi:putative inorganic carbon (HCO3(-)) transporter